MESILAGVGAVVFVLVVMRRLRRDDSITLPTSGGGAQASMQQPGGGAPAVLDLVRSGRKIEAIKLYRAQTGVGLREAKDAVEALAQKPSP